VNDLIKRFLFISGIGIAIYLLSKTDMAREIIKRFEGYSATPYKDAAGFWTIGYGHRIVKGDTWYPEGDRRIITEPEASALLDHDMAGARKTVLWYSRVPLNSAQIDALTSFVYNVGSGNFASSTLLQKLNDGDYSGAADEFLKWVHAGGQKLAGLVSRREIEKNLFLS